MIKPPFALYAAERSMNMVCPLQPWPNPPDPKYAGMPPITDFVAETVVTRRVFQSRHHLASGDWETEFEDHAGRVHRMPTCEWFARAIWPSNVITYTIPQPKHWLQWIIFATAIAALLAHAL